MINVDQQTLMVFKEVYESGCCNTTSKKLNISNSKVTRLLANMRDYYQDSLFIRKRDGFIPTEKAKSLYPKVCIIVALYSDLSDIKVSTNAIKECNVAIPTTLSVGFPEYINQQFQHLDEPPLVTIKAINNKVCEELLSGDTNLAVIPDQCQLIQKDLVKYQDSIISNPIGVGEFVYIAAHCDHPIFQGALTLERISQYPFAVTAVAGFNDTIDPFEAFCQKNSRQLNMHHKTYSLAGLMSHLTENQAISFIGTHCAATFLNMMPAMKTVKMPQTQYDRLHSVAPKPSYSLLYKHTERSSIPTELIDSLNSFIKQQIILRSTKT